jgi:pimeloyl-ACP methyl ester carboxylesterase
MWRVGVIVYSLILFGLWSVTLYAAEQQTVMVTAPSAAPENVRIGLTHQQENPEPGTGTPNDERGTFKVPADRAGNAPMRIYVLYGQYGWATSSGMYYLAQSLAQYGEVSIHEWDDRTVVPQARRHSGKVVVIGFSLGANTAVAIANKLPHVDLLIAYDPSRLSPLVDVAGGAFTQHVAPTVRRAICFYNPYAWYFGGARLEGSQVELVPIINYHLAVAADQRLHEITEDAVRKVAVTPSAKEPSAVNAASRPSTAGMKPEETSIARIETVREPTPLGSNQVPVIPNALPKISFP